MFSNASLTGLRAFESVVRTGSITAAADELSVTHSAVSHQVKKLENDLAVRLLLRRGRGVVATAAGENLAQALSKSFESIDEAVRRAAQTKALEDITISCTGTFLLHWLIPRLYRFKRTWPGIQLKLLEDFQPMDFTTRSYDVAIRVGPPPWPPGISITNLEIERFGPVLSRDMADRNGIKDADSMVEAARVHTRTRPSAWVDWAAASDLTLPPDAAATWFDHYYFLLEGVRAGLGIGVVPELMVRDDVARGNLLAPAGFRDSGNIYVMACRENDDRSEVVAFRDWLTGEFKAISNSDERFENSTRPDVT